MATCSEINASAPNKSSLDETQCPEIIVNFGVFFDGTNNQRLQVATGKLNRAKNADKKKEKIKKNIESLGGTFDEDQFKKNGNIKYSFNGNPSPDKEKEIEKINKTIAKYNKKYGNRLDDNESEIVESFSWDNASGEKNDNDNNKQALNERSGFHVGMSRSSMQGVDFTNIARLEPLYNFHQTGETIFSYRIYVSGSGTFADLNRGVDVSGLAFGQGSAGVVQKVKDALDALTEKIKGIKNNSNIKEVNYKFNVFGFSRGATEARLFVDLLSNWRTGNRHEILNNIIVEYNNTFIDKEDNSCITFPKLKTFEFPFIGVYDTVSSVGTTPGIWNGFIAPTLTKGGEAISHTVSKSHEQNKEELGLDTLVYEGSVKHVVHICALDEFRENFSLQVMPNNSKVEQFFMPGIHTDIGGGDLDGYDEEKYIAKTYDKKDLYIPKIVTPGETRKASDLLVINKENLKELGWIKDSGDSSLMSDLVIEEKDIIRTQRYSEHGYAYLSLTILAKKACENTCKFENLESKYSIPEDLPQSFDAMKTAWAGADSKFGHCFFPKEDLKYKWLRQKYLHFSSNIKKTAVVIVNGPNLTESDDGKEAVSYYDRFLDYHPKGWYGKITESGLTDIVFEEAGNQNNDDYLGEAVAVFKSVNEKYTVIKTKGDQKVNEYKFIRLPEITIKNGKKYYREEEITEIIEGVPAEVTIYGKANNKNEAHNRVFVGMTKPSVKNTTTLDSGNYYAYKRQMDDPKKVYRNEAYLIVNNRKNSSNDGLNNTIDSFTANMTLRGTKDGKGKDLKGVFLHRTNWDGNATFSSEGCLIIDGRDWNEVDKLLGQSQDVFIHLNRT